ncbi:MAG TPA: hypothetical protein VGN72_01280 [Tepidisphaeraceae bacterium]|nr:hypothetical protein [Tepidisphaeraceae bacterium]
MNLDTVASVARRMRRSGVSMNPTSAYQALRSHEIDLTGNPKEAPRAEAVAA